MDFLTWLALSGALLLVMALASAWLRRLPITTSFVYLGIGLAIGPLGFGQLRIDFIDGRVWLLHLTEIAVIVSLFIGGLKLRLPFTNAAWGAAVRLAGPVMLVSIFAVAAFAHYALGLSWWLAVLLGAVLAPTDPVLASTVSVDAADDHDRMRYGLSGEAGFNDGAAFPFVVLALLGLSAPLDGDALAGSALHRVLWAVPVGLLFGFRLGKSVGQLAIWLRSQHRDSEAPNDFLALALIALAYVGAEWIGAWGFLAAFMAGVGFRRAERGVARANPLPPLLPALASTNDADGDPPLHGRPAEAVVVEMPGAPDLAHPTIAAGVVVSEMVSFGNTVERLLEVMLVILVGVAVGSVWDWRAVPLSIALFVVIRPLAVIALLPGTRTTLLQRGLMGWFGIRGIGSLYYLAYALNQGLDAVAAELVGLTLSVIALSIVLHGASAQPLLRFYEHRLERIAT